MIPATTKTHTDRKLKIAKAYLIVKAKLIQKGYDEEIDWQYDVSLDDLTEEKLLNEAAWVILNSGMREVVVRKRFPYIKKAFQNFQSAQNIYSNSQVCRANALLHFNNAPKIDAIISIAKHISVTGFAQVLKNIRQSGTDYLVKFPFIGPVTSTHLAKNIGLSVVKPDRHLVKLASAFGFENVSNMCDEISDITQDPIAVIDIVLWRFTSLYKSRALTLASKIGE